MKSAAALSRYSAEACYRDCIGAAEPIIECTATIATAQTASNSLPALAIRGLASIVTLLPNSFFTRPAHTPRVIVAAPTGNFLSLADPNLSLTAPISPDIRT